MICKHCGTIIQDDDNFCSKCGAAYSDTSNEIEEYTPIISTPERNKRVPLTLIITAIIMIVFMTFFPIFKIELSYEKTKEIGEIGYATMLTNNIDSHTISGLSEAMTFSRLTYIGVIIITAVTIIFSWLKKDTFAWVTALLYIPCACFYYGKLSNQFKNFDKYTLFEAEWSISMLVLRICLLIILIYCYTLMIKNTSSKKKARIV